MIRQRGASARLVLKAALKRQSIILMAIVAVRPGTASAADWLITPRLQVRETYTDNVRLAGRGDEQSDFVTEIDPGVRIVGRGARLQVEADYAFKYKAYVNNSDANGHNHSLRSHALMDVWDRKLFVDAAASIAQQNISTLGALTTSDANINPNRAEIRQATISPFWVSRLGTFANAEARYSWNKIQSDGATSALNSQSDLVSLGLSSGLDFSNLGWSLNYSKQQIDSDEGQFSERTLESVKASASYRVLPTLAAIATVGHDDNSYGDVRGKTKGTFYSVGFEWVPSSRTKVRAEVGEHYFGNTAALNAEHRTRLTTWSLVYSEQIVATPGQFGLPVGLDTAATLDRLFVTQFPDPVERAQAVRAFIDLNGLPATLPGTVDFLTNQVSLSERLQGTFAMRGVRGSLIASIFHEKRTNQSSGATALGTDPFSLSDEVKQTGYSTILTWRFAQHTSGSVSLGQIRSKLPEVSRKDTNTNFRLGLTHQFYSKLHGSIEYRWTDRESNGAVDVRENAISGFLSMYF
jgi:uncharacterized protein (PEP-CTERM system associated)